MRAIQYYGLGDIRYEDVPEPQPGPGEVKIRVKVNGLCGSDVHEYFDGPMSSTVEPHPLTGHSIPFIMGHEFSGDVVALGEGVTKVMLGDRVAIQPTQSCGICPRCRIGRRHLCTKIAIHGFNCEGGGLADFTVVRQDMVHVLPPSVSYELGALVEPMAVAYRAMKRTQVKPGGLLSIFGAGPIGLGTLLACKRVGIRTIVSDPSLHRRTAAIMLGADHVVDPSKDQVSDVIAELTDGLGADGAIDAAGVSETVDAALANTRPDGRIVVVGMHTQPITIPPMALLTSEVVLTGNGLYHDEFPEVIQAMADGCYSTDGWVSTIDFGRVVEDGLIPLHAQKATKLLVQVDNVQIAGVTGE